MKKRRNEKHGKKIRNLVAICALCAIVLSVSTYAWFIGFKRVNVNGFDIDIATTEGLFLSMNGEDWSYQLDPDTAEAYVGNTNTWAENGLKPMSSIGDMDATASRMKLYEKGSLTTVAGGYRLLATRVDNYNTDGTGPALKQGDGYVAFDLFIKNLSGEEYYTENNIRNEEAIFLTTNSAVTVAAAGGVPNTGIENSVRVAFAQIGRVEATTGATGDETEISNITAITCSDVEASDGQVQVTGICRNAQIWEPNDTDHVQNALNYYNTSCRPRLVTGTDVEDSKSYQLTEPGNTCAELDTTTAYPTYAISRRIDIADNVNVYDGTAYNSYTANTKTYADYTTAAAEEDFDGSEFKLVEFPYFTDTMKDLKGNERPEFMRLAPNSITKVRVYIWIEGQDIDNYDFAQLGLKISVNFGFTKERFEEEDIEYEGPSTDITPSDSQ